MQQANEKAVIKPLLNVKHFLNLREPSSILQRRRNHIDCKAMCRRVQQQRYNTEGRKWLQGA
jgi:hypothetical protein